MEYQKNIAIYIGDQLTRQNHQTLFHFPCQLPSSPLTLWHHLAVKLILNTHSTATMAKMGRIQGNAMVWVWPSNKKLIDRGIRLICEVTGKDYNLSCHLLFEAMEKVEQLREAGQPVPSPVATVIEQFSLKTK